MTRLLVLVPTYASQLLQEFGFFTHGTWIMPNAPEWSVTDIPARQYAAFLSIFPDGKLIASFLGEEQEEEQAA